MVIRVSTSIQDRWAVLKVADNGPGVPSELRERIFDPYYTSRSEGTGLGLAITKKVVLEHRGSIRCEGSEFMGALFVIKIPLAEKN